MTTTVMIDPTGEASPRLKARIAGVAYLLAFVTGFFALFGERGLPIVFDAANVAATACYLVVTLLFYDIFKPVNRAISLIAAFFSVAGCTVGTLSLFHVVDWPVNSLVFFGFYCVLIGYLIFRSTFLPRILGVLMVLAGLGWLTFLSPTLAHSLSPFNMAPGIFGEGVLTLWLLVVGLDAQRWKDQASRA